MFSGSLILLPSSLLSHQCGTSHWSTTFQLPSQELHNCGPKATFILVQETKSDTDPSAPLPLLITMATIQSPPPELLRLALQLGAQIISDFAEDDEYEERVKKRNTFLLAASFVCSAWRVAGQSVLWELVYIGSDDAAQRFLRSPVLGRLQTRELTIQVNAEDEKEVTAASIATMLATVVGLRSLSIFTISEELDLGVLCSKNLSGVELPPFYRACALLICSYSPGLTRLILDNIAFSSPSSRPSAINPPFALRTLDIYNAAAQVLPYPHSSPTPQVLSPCLNLHIARTSLTPR